jgi:hypothetical protein
MSLHGAYLTNWINPGRRIDLAANNRYLKARKENQELVAEARPRDATDPEKAIATYRGAMVAMYEYESIVIETGLIAELMGDRNKGDAHILDRLTLCLFKLGRYDEADAAVVEFQRRFPNCYPSTVFTAVLKRHNRARRCAGHFHPLRQTLEDRYCFESKKASHPLRDGRPGNTYVSA